MGQNSAIEWTTHTHNPWTGCTKVSDGCKFCYAEALMDKRWGKVKWGDNGTRARASDAYLREPFKWDRLAKAAGERHRVFCASLADVFEDRPELMPWRRDLFDTICRTPNLDWLLLTKRPENALRMMVEAGLYAVENPNLPHPQPNLWIGTSVEDQKNADARIPHLLQCPAAVRFLSAEPLLGPISFRWLAGWPENAPTTAMNPTGITDEYDGLRRLDWVIVGGESGHGARPMHPDWARNLRDQCQAAGVAFFFKQWGEWSPRVGQFSDEQLWARDRSGGVLWDNRIPQMIRVGKKAAGRLLDGREWSEFPAAVAAV